VVWGVLRCSARRRMLRIAWWNGPVSRAGASATPSPAPRFSFRCGSAAGATGPSPTTRRRACARRRCGPGAEPPRGSSLEGGNAGRVLASGLKAPLKSREARQKTNPRPAINGSGGQTLVAEVPEADESRWPCPGWLQAGLLASGSSSAAPSHRRYARRQWLLRRSSPVTAARPRPICTAFPFHPALGREPTTTSPYPRCREKSIKNRRPLVLTGRRSRIASVLTNRRGRYI
jgi:hypothetical protein